MTSGGGSDQSPSLGASRCPECGCPCQNCCDSSNGGFEYQQEEIEKLRNLARTQQSSLRRLESDLDSEASARTREQHKLQEELARLRDRYDRLMESHKKLSRLNSGLEERLLGMAERLQAETAQLADCQQRLGLSEAATVAARDEAARLRSDCGLAVQLLQSQPPDSFLRAPASAPGPSPLVPASVSVFLPTFPPTFAHVPAQAPPPPLLPPPPTSAQHQQRHQPQVCKSPSEASLGSAVLHL